jgi:hypothetical protein
VARVVEHRPLRPELGQHELGRLAPAGLRHVDQPAVALDDPQVLEADHLAARVDGAGHGQHGTAQRRAPTLFDRSAGTPPAHPGAGQPPKLADRSLRRCGQRDVLGVAVEPERLRSRRWIDDHAHQQPFGGGAEAPPDALDPLRRVARQPLERDLVLERTALPATAVARHRLGLGHFGDRAVERHAHVAVLGAVAVQDHRASLDPE